MPWIRLDTSYLSNPRSRRLSWESFTLLPIVALWAKECDPREGRIPVDDLSPESLSALANGCHCDICDRAVKEWIKVGYLIRDGEFFVFKAWRKFQPDPTAAARKRLERQRKAESDAEAPVTDVTVTTVSHVDGTLRDETKKKRTTPQPPSKGERPRTARQARKEDLLASVDGLTDTDLDERFDEMVRHDQEDRAIALVNILARAGHPWAKRKREEPR